MELPRGSHSVPAAGDLDGDGAADIVAAISDKRKRELHIIYGNAAMVDGMVDRMAKEMAASPKIIATGGLAPLLTDPLAAPPDDAGRHDPLWTLRGLAVLAERAGRPEPGSG